MSITLQLNAVSKKTDNKQGASQAAGKQDVQAFVTLAKLETAKNLEPNINQLTKGINTPAKYFIQEPIESSSFPIHCLSALSRHQNTFFSSIIATLF